MATQTISKKLSDLLATKNLEVRYTDAQGKNSNPVDADVISFDWSGPSGRNYGTVVIVLEESDLLMFFGDNLGRSMEDPQDKSAWLGSEDQQGFVQQIKNFATRNNIGTFTLMDINQLKHHMAGMAAIKEGLFEGYYGNRKVSYMGEATAARLVIKHNRTLGETDKRYRYVESLFIETADGERFKLPFVKLAGGRAMLEHVRQGGRPYDIRGCHIAEMVTEMNVLSRFRRASQSRVFEGSTANLVESANNYYEQIKNNLAVMSSSRGYQQYFESWTPADINSETQLVENIKEMFVQQTLDNRIESALPILAKIQQQGTAMKEAEIFETWANRLVEGTWALPDDAQAQAKLNTLMSKELIVGPDATNATEQLYDVVGDDQLFDILQDLASRDPRANIWDDSDVQARLAQLGIQTPQSTEAEPADVAQDTAPPQQGVAEGYQLDEGAVETITALAKKIPGIGKYYQMAQQYKPQLIEILKTSKSSKEVKQKMEQLAAGQSATVAESGMTKQLGGLAVGSGSILSTMWMNAMGMIDGVLAHAAAGEVGGAVASGSILGLIPVTLMLFAAMLLFKGSKQSSDEKAQAFQAQRGQQGMAEAAKWRQGYRASGHPPGYQHKSGEIGPLGGTYDTTSNYGDEVKVPVNRYRDEPDRLADREKTKLSTSGKPLTAKNAARNLKTAIAQAKGRHGPVGVLPEQGVAEAGPFSYGKAPRRGSVADLAAKKRREQERGKQPIEPKDQQVGVAKVTKGVAETERQPGRFSGAWQILVNGKKVHSFRGNFDQETADRVGVVKAASRGLYNPGSGDKIKIVPVMLDQKQGVAEGVNDYLWHGSKSEHEILYPQQAKDTGGKEESNKNAVYATPSAKVAIAMGLTTPGSDTGMFPNDPQMVLFSGNIRKGQMVYLHKVPKDLFIKHNSREWYSKPGVEAVKPIEVKTIPVDQWLHLIRQATPQDLELRKKYMKKQGVAEGYDDEDEGNPVMNAIIGRIMRTRPDLLDYDMQKLQAAIRDVALDVGDVDEIGSSDISGWVKRVEQNLSGVSEGTEFGAYYYEQLAQKVFDIAPNLENENDILKAGYDIAKKELGARANGIFRDEDFFSDFVSAYGYLKKNHLDEGSCNQTMEGEYCPEHGLAECAMEEGWKGELVGGTLGSIAGTMAGQSVAGPIGALVGGGLAGTAGGMIGRKLGDIGDDEPKKLAEIAPLVGVGAAAARALIPALSKVGPKLAQMFSRAGQAAAPAVKKGAEVAAAGAGQAAKQGAEIAAKNAIPIGIGAGAYSAITDIAQGLVGGVGEVYKDVAGAASAIGQAVGNAVDENTILQLATLAVKYALPVGIVLALLYGGKKVIDKVMAESADDPINYNAAITGSYYESDELARIKKLALLK